MRNRPGSFHASFLGALEELTKQGIHAARDRCLPWALLELWKELFPNAKIYALDINPECTEYEDWPRVKITIGSQNDPVALEEWTQQVTDPIDVIIDDGSHVMEHLKTSFMHLFPKLRPGGIYVLEDLGTCYMPKYGGRQPRPRTMIELVKWFAGLRRPSTMIEVLKSFVDNINETWSGEAILSKSTRCTSIPTSASSTRSDPALKSLSLGQCLFARAWLQLALVLAESAPVVGDCGIHFRGDDPRQVELGITLAPDYQGRGLATEALRSVLGYVFGSLGKHRASAVTDAENHAAAGLFRRVGFRQEAHFVEHVWYKGAWGASTCSACCTGSGKPG